MNSAKLKEFILRWLICTVAVLVAEHIVSGIHYDSWVDLLIATLILGLLNYFIKPLLMILSMPLLIFTLGFFTLVINAFLLLTVSYLVKGFHVDGFAPAFWGALVISIVTILLNILIGFNSLRVHKIKRDTDDDDIIDV
ncbi:MAG TPA: phage holin family protein [Verrucomicrobiota bacterium]|nr:phage holin family protein [Verrucomicrobiota bacterium]